MERRLQFCANKEGEATRYFGKLTNYLLWSTALSCKFNGLDTFNPIHWLANSNGYVGWVIYMQWCIHDYCSYMHIHFSYSLVILCYSIDADGHSCCHCGIGTMVCVRDKRMGISTSHPICVSYIFSICYNYCSSAMKQISYYYWNDFCIWTKSAFSLPVC